MTKTYKLQQPQRHFDDYDDTDASPRKMVHAGKSEPVRKEEIVSSTPNRKTAHENNTGPVFNQCNIINLVTPDKPSPEMMDLLQTMTQTQNLPEMTAVARAVSKKSEPYEDDDIDKIVLDMDLDKIEREYYSKKVEKYEEDFDKMAMELDIERIEREYYGKRSSTTVRRQQIIEGPYLQRNIQTQRTVTKRKRVENPYKKKVRQIYNPYLKK